jgi:4'-phosphopantetheinyl transferase
MEITTNIKMIRDDNIYLSSFAFIEDCSLLRLKEVESALHPLEYKRYELFTSDVRKVSYLLGRYCAKKAIASLFEIKHLNYIHIDSGVFNQPVIKEPNIPNILVSISHDGLSAIALAYPEEHPMGIDIETLDEEKTDEIQEHLTQQEVNLSRGLNCDNVTFNTILWTAKESLSKVLKTGLTASLSILEINTLEVNLQGYYRCTFKNFYQYQTISMIYNDKIITMIFPRYTKVELNNFKI